MDITAILQERAVSVRMMKNHEKSIKPFDINGKENTQFIWQKNINTMHNLVCLFII